MIFISKRSDPQGDTTPCHCIKISFPVEEFISHPPLCRSSNPQLSSRMDTSSPSKRRGREQKESTLSLEQHQGENRSLSRIQINVFTHCFLVLVFMKLLSLSVETVLCDLKILDYSYLGLGLVSLYKDSQ
jgi:hypothetical protein